MAPKTLGVALRTLGVASRTLEVAPRTLELVFEIYVKFSIFFCFEICIKLILSIAIISPQGYP